MKLIKVSTDLELSLHDFPEGTYEEQNKFLRGLIGNGCRIYEHVMPKRLYTELHMRNEATNIPGQCVSMLMDEEAFLKENSINHVGSFLYETDKHGHPIMGNILFVGEKWTDEGIDFCGIEESVLSVLDRRLNDVTRLLTKNLQKERR